jgi:starch-binding outer membrane protein, SusD/RagB family
MIMRNILKITLAFVLLLTMGCHKEYLDPVPKTSLSDLSVFDTKDRVVAQVNGMYAAVKVGAYLGGRFQVYGDLRGDNFIPNSSNLVTNFATWNHTEVSSTNEVQNFWGAVYAAINVINVFMDGLKNNWDGGKLTGKITQDEYNQFMSEALTLRAMCYFDLLRMYCKPYVLNAGAGPGVPLRLKAEKTAEGNDLARSSVDAVYTQILADLNAAEPLAVLNYSTDLLNTTRVHRNTVIALKTRVYLAKGDWASVVSESAKMVSASAPFVSASGVANALNSTYSGLWTSPYTSKESIFSMPMTTTNTPGTQNGLPHYFSQGSSESYYLLAASPVYAAMAATDVRKTLMVAVGTKYYLTKWPDLTTLTNYPPVIRYAEVLLSRAEALVRSGGAVTQGAVDLLNAVRVRSYPTGAYTLASFASAADFYTAVLQERNFEFLGEGIRVYDIMRLGQTIPAKDGGNMGTVGAIPSSSVGYMWPIPANELSLNKLMTPNE